MSADYLAIARRVPRRAMEHAPAQKAQKAHKGGLCALNALFAHPDSAGAIQGWYETRSAIRQFKGGYEKAMAERLAYGELVEAWCGANPVTHDRLHCAGCGKPLGAEVLELSDGACVHWERHREFTCLIAYGDPRKRRATEALAALGLQPPMGWGT